MKRKNCNLTTQMTDNYKTQLPSIIDKTRSQSLHRFNNISSLYSSKEKNSVRPLLSESAVNKISFRQQQFKIQIDDFFGRSGLPCFPYKKIFSSNYQANNHVNFGRKQLYLQRKEIKDLFINATSQLNKLINQKDISLSSIFLRKKDIFHKCLQSLTYQIGKQCKERGQLLKILLLEQQQNIETMLQICLISYQQIQRENQVQLESICEIYQNEMNDLQKQISNLNQNIEQLKRIVKVQTNQNRVIKNRSNKLAKSMHKNKLLQKSSSINEEKIKLSQRQSRQQLHSSILNHDFSTEIVPIQNLLGQYFNNRGSQPQEFYQPIRYLLQTGINTDPLPQQIEKAVQNSEFKTVLDTAIQTKTEKTQSELQLQKMQAKIKKMVKQKQDYEFTMKNQISILQEKLKYHCRHANELNKENEKIDKLLIVKENEIQKLKNQMSSIKKRVQSSSKQQKIKQQKQKKDRVHKMRKNVQGEKLNRQNYKSKGSSFSIPIEQQQKAEKIYEIKQLKTVQKNKKIITEIQPHQQQVINKQEKLKKNLQKYKGLRKEFKKVAILKSTTNHLLHPVQIQPSIPSNQSLSSNSIPLIQSNQQQQYIENQLQPIIQVNKQKKTSIRPSSAENYSLNEEVSFNSSQHIKSPLNTSSDREISSEQQKEGQINKQSVKPKVRKEAFLLNKACQSNMIQIEEKQTMTDQCQSNDPVFKVIIRRHQDQKNQQQSIKEDLPVASKKEIQSGIIWRNLPKQDAELMRNRYRKNEKEMMSLKSRLAQHESKQNEIQTVENTLWLQEITINRMKDLLNKMVVTQKNKLQQMINEYKQMFKCKIPIQRHMKVANVAMRRSFHFTRRTIKIYSHHQPKSQSPAVALFIKKYFNHFKTRHNKISKFCQDIGQRYFLKYKNKLSMIFPKTDNIHSMYNIHSIVLENPSPYILKVSALLAKQTFTEICRDLHKVMSQRKIDSDTYFQVISRNQDIPCILEQMQLKINLNYAVRSLADRKYRQIITAIWHPNFNQNSLRYIKKLIELDEDGNKGYRNHSLLLFVYICNLLDESRFKFQLDLMQTTEKKFRQCLPSILSLNFWPSVIQNLDELWPIEQKVTMSTPEIAICIIEECFKYKNSYEGIVGMIWDGLVGNASEYLSLEQWSMLLLSIRCQLQLRMICQIAFCQMAQRKIQRSYLISKKEMCMLVAFILSEKGGTILANFPSRLECQIQNDMLSTEYIQFTHLQNLVISRGLTMAESLCNKISNRIMKKKNLDLNLQLALRVLKSYILENEIGEEIDQMVGDLKLVKDKCLYCLLSQYQRKNQRKLYPELYTSIQ